MKNLNNKTILITGGTGSFGQHFIRIVIERYQPKKLIVYSRDELKQFEMYQEFPFEPGGKMRYFLGDVRDLPRLKTAMDGVDIVIHAAALKQVPAAEYNPFEAVKTNVIGGQNVIDAAFVSNVQKVFFTSSDKAVNPTNVMGTTKLMGERLMTAANVTRRGENCPVFGVSRFGNVLGSSGSVIPIFQNQIKIFI